VSEPAYPSSSRLQEEKVEVKKRQHIVFWHDLFEGDDIDPLCRILRGIVRQSI
jgi:hypothetical protein